MNPDRDELVWAAKAAGIKLVFDANGLPRDCTGIEPAMDILSAKLWNSREDDGDAFRLAVKLCQYHLFRESILRVCVATDRDDGFHEDCTANPCAATRLAITRAAAAIGRTMP